MEDNAISPIKPKALIGQLQAIFSPVMLMGRLQAYKTKAKSRIINNILTPKIHSLRENLKPWPCHIDCYHSVNAASLALIFSHKDWTFFKVNKLLVMEDNAVLPFELNYKLKLIPCMILFQIIIFKMEFLYL